MHPGGDLAQPLERRPEVLRLPLLVGMLALLPGEQDDVARRGEAAAGHALDELAVLPRDRGRDGGRAVLAKGGQPGELGGDRVPAVIPLAVDPQRPCAAPGRGFDPIGRVLGDADEARPGAGRKVVAGEGRGGQPVEPVRRDGRCAPRGRAAPRPYRTR